MQTPGNAAIAAYGKEEVWINAQRQTARHALTNCDFTFADMCDAAARLDRFAPLLSTYFPELQTSGGRIESPVISLNDGPLRVRLGLDGPALGRIYVKADHDLAVAGSIKARGGIYEVLEFAEQLARREGLLEGARDYGTLAGEAARMVFSRYTVMVGSTGNLGLSIGILSAALGFKVRVFMSCEAQNWKKQLLRQHGVEVVESSGDYAEAVHGGREQALQDPRAHFIDDERSRSLFLGYSVAALRLQEQFRAQGIVVDAAHPLVVYLPCGVGGGPGGIAFGLAQVFGDAVHCWFVEPVASACFLTRMRHPDQPGISVYDVGLDNATQADGLAVPVASELAYAQMRHLLAGVVTVSDAALRADVGVLWQQARMKVEPSAASALAGLRAVTGTAAGRQWVADAGLAPVWPQATHLVWSTGGRLLPDEVFKQYLA